jgi:hypothetical protein
MCDHRLRALLERFQVARGAQGLWMRGPNPYRPGLAWDAEGWERYRVNRGEIGLAASLYVGQGQRARLFAVDVREAILRRQRRRDDDRSAPA